MLKCIFLSALALLVTLVTAGQPRKLTPHVWAVDVGTCTFDFTPLARVERTLVLAHAGTEMMLH